MICLADWESRLAALEGPLGALARSLWARLQHVAPRAPHPQCGAYPRDEGTFELTWNNGPHHLDAEIHPDGRVSWFYYNRETEEREFEEGPPDTLFARLDRLRPLPPTGEEHPSEELDGDATRPLSEEEITGLLALLATMSETVPPPSSQAPRLSDLPASLGGGALFASGR